MNKKLVLHTSVLKLNDVLGCGNRGISEIDWLWTIQLLKDNAWLHYNLCVHYFSIIQQAVVNYSLVRIMYMKLLTHSLIHYSLHSEYHTSLYRERLRENELHMISRTSKNTSSLTSHTEMHFQFFYLWFIYELFRMYTKIKNTGIHRNRNWKGDRVLTCKPYFSK